MENRAIAIAQIVVLALSFIMSGAVVPILLYKGIL